MRSFWDIHRHWFLPSWLGIVKSEIKLLMIVLLGVLAIFEWWVVRNKNYRVFPCLVQHGSCGLHFREFWRFSFKFITRWSFHLIRRFFFINPKDIGSLILSVFWNGWVFLCQLRLRCPSTLPPSILSCNLGREFLFFILPHRLKKKWLLYLFLKKFSDGNNKYS